MKKQTSFLNAVKWSYTANWGEKGLSAIFTTLLAVVLGPKDYGVASIALMYIAFLQLFLDQGLVTALIQKLDLETEHLDSVFWLDMVLGVGLIIVSVLCSGWWAAKNHAPEIRTIISVLSLDIPIAALATVQGALMRKEMNFKGFAICSNVSMLISGVVGVCMAFTGFGVWALVCQQIVRDLVNCVMVWRFNTWRPRFRFSWKHLRDLMNFSILNFVAQLGLFAEGQASAILLGLFYGPLAVGLYRYAERLMSAVITMATSSIQSVALPEFSRFQNSPLELRKSILACIRLSSGVTLPALAGLAAVSTPLLVFLGPNWVPATGVLKLLCGVGAALLYAFFTGPLLQAQSKGRELVLVVWVRVLVGLAILVTVALMVKDGSVATQLLGIGFARLLTEVLIVTPAFVYILMRISGISIREFVSAMAPGAFAAGAVLGAVMLLGSVSWLAEAKTVFLLATEVIAGGVVGIAVLMTLEKQLREPVLALLRRNV